ncbi:prepilin-type N-terminal cleavage/methylation domain-containing protein [Candidatus Uhrbacteria bacterium]|nr:prepilin-type N-terminal cleavage/methylation domain-containing protein [Candidatus Uhrbacteria bacterium]
MTGVRKCKMQNVKCKILNFKFLILHSNRGFTLMEMLVALTLFSVVVTVTTDLFFTFQRTSRRTENLESVVASGRLMMEQIAREARQGTIDYDWYARQSIDLSARAAQPVLALRDREGGQVQFEFDENLGTLMMSRRGGNPESLNSPDTAVLRNAYFSITPASDPFQFISDQDDPRAGQFGADIQPRVTILLALRTAALRGQQNYLEYDLQTTISSRVYRR